MNPKIKVLLQRPSALMEMIQRGRDPQSRHCPSCGGPPAPGTLDRRFGVMTLRRCNTCHLLFRTPTDTPAKSSSFYQEDYTEETVTELPDAALLDELFRTGFSSKGDISPYIQLVERFHGGTPVKIMDYGCSWGYNTWRFDKAGFSASGVEVSRPRCRFGREQLGVDAHDSAADLPADFNAFFSSHVFEHVPSPAASFRDAARLLGRDGGIFIIITPNGCQEFRDKRPGRWHELWGRKHPNFLDDKFWHQLLGSLPHAILSRSEDTSVKAPISELTRESLLSGKGYDLSGEELIVVGSIPAGSGA